MAIMEGIESRGGLAFVAEEMERVACDDDAARQPPPLLMSRVTVAGCSDAFKGRQDQRHGGIEYLNALTVFHQHALGHAVAGILFVASLPTGHRLRHGQAGCWCGRHREYGMRSHSSPRDGASSQPLDHNNEGPSVLVASLVGGLASGMLFLLLRWLRSGSPAAPPTPGSSEHLDRDGALAGQVN